MQAERFDLNDIEHEPTDQQLAGLMAQVSAEARKRAEAARTTLMTTLRAEIVAARQRQAAT